MKKHNFKKLIALGLAAGFVASAPAIANEEKDSSGTVLVAKDETSSSLLANGEKEETSEAAILLAGSCGSKCGGANRRGTGYSQSPQVVEEDPYYQGQRGYGCNGVAPRGGSCSASTPRGHSCSAPTQPSQYQYRT